MKRTTLLPCCLLICLISALTSQSQMITGVWKGRINRQKAEVKIIQQGDSLTGTAYYYESASHYRRYTIKGYFDAQTNEAVWWDDQLIEEKTGRNSGPGKLALLSRADFNCPGDGRMMLDGTSGRRQPAQPGGDLHLDKISDPLFPDEWDFVIDNYTVGASDPYIIDSIAAISLHPSPAPAPVEKSAPVVASRPPVSNPPTEQKLPAAPVSKPVIEKPAPVMAAAPSIEEKFLTRKKVQVTEIPITGDSVELRFYDNAEIDGDSISLFLNDKLMFEHIRLLGTPYILKLAVNALNDSNELIMVAENLGSIPPNTAYMVAIVGEQRYEARLVSTEGSSAMIRFIKQPTAAPR